MNAIIRVFIAVAAAICFFALCFASEYMEYGMGVICEKVRELKTNQEDCSETITEYVEVKKAFSIGAFIKERYEFPSINVIFSILIFAAVLLTLIFFLKFKIKHGSSFAAIIIIMFYIAMLMISVHWCRYDVMYLTYGFLQSLSIGVTVGLNVHRLDFSFLNSEASGEEKKNIDGELKKNRLQLMYDKWSKLFMWFLGLIILVFFLGSLQLLGNIAQTMGISATYLYQEMLMIQAIVLLPLTFFGIGGQIYFKMAKIADMMTAIKDYDSTCPYRKSREISPTNGETI